MNDSESENENGLDEINISPDTPVKLVKLDPDILEGFADPVKAGQPIHFVDKDSDMRAVLYTNTTPVKSIEQIRNCTQYLIHTESDSIYLLIIPDQRRRTWRNLFGLLRGKRE